MKTRIYAAPAVKGLSRAPTSDTTERITYTKKRYFMEKYGIR